MKIIAKSIITSSLFVFLTNISYAMCTDQMVNNIDGAKITSTIKDISTNYSATVDNGSHHQCWNNQDLKYVQITVNMKTPHDGNFTQRIDTSMDVSKHGHFEANIENIVTDLKVNDFLRIPLQYDLTLINTDDNNDQTWEHWHCAIKIYNLGSLNSQWRTACVPKQ